MHDKSKLLKKNAAYPEENLEQAIRMVVSYKWPQKAVCQAFGIPRQVLCDNLKKENKYSNSRAPYKAYSKSDMAAAIKLVEEENVTLKAAALRYGIPKATLYCRINKANGPAKIKPKKIPQAKVAENLQPEAGMVLF